MKRISIICGKGLETFIEPIANALDKSDKYLTDRVYLDGTGDVTKQLRETIDWADIVWLEWANEWAINATNDLIFPEILDKKVIVRLHSYEALSNMPSNIKWENVNKLIFVAPHIIDIANKYNDGFATEVDHVVIPNGVDLTKCKFVEKDKKDADFHDIAWVGYINNKKSPELMIQVMNELCGVEDAAYKLHVAGSFQDPRYEIYLRHMVDELGLKDNVIFYGWINDMNKWYKDKHTLLSTSIHEGHSYCIMEAMARGIVPVIHNFYGADKLYPRSLLFNTIQEAVDILTTARIFSKTDLRQDVINKGWTFSNQMKQIKEVIDGI